MKNAFLLQSKSLVVSNIASMFHLCLSGATNSGILRTLPHGGTRHLSESADGDVIDGCRQVNPDIEI